MLEVASLSNSSEVVFSFSLLVVVFFSQIKMCYIIKASVWELMTMSDEYRTTKLCLDEGLTLD